MSDQFLNELRREPRPEFARELRDRLHAQGAAESRAAWPPAVLPAALAAVFLAIGAGALFTFPAVRASAQAFLDLFRVRTFTAVSVSDSRIAQLENGKLDLQALAGSHVETLRDPGPPRAFGSAGEAMAALGFMPKTPGSLPGALLADTVWVQGEAAARVTLDLAKLRALLETLEIRDLTPPPGLDGQTMTVRVPAVVRQTFVSEHHRVSLLQSRGPEVELPAGIDLAQLGEIGLRIAGLGAAEARRLARSIDWRTTLVVPVPASVGAFRDVEVHGRRGLMVSVMAKDATPKHERRRESAIVLWTEDDMVFALCGDLSNMDLLEMANALP